jgi:hypothetical protein
MATIILPEQIQSLIDADVDRLPSCCAQDDGKNKKVCKKTMAAMKNAVAAMFCEFEMS